MLYSKESLIKSYDKAKRLNDAYEKVNNQLRQQNAELLEAAIEVVKQHSTDPKSIHHKIWELQRVINKYTQS